MGSRLGYWGAVVVIMLGAAALHAPVLDMGYTLDDYAQAAMVDGYYPVARAPWDLFTFADGTRAETKALMDSGFFPWWAHPEVRLSMFRPLSSSLTALDRQLFGDNALAQHWHSLCWWWGMLVAVALVLRRLLPAPVALTALSMLAVDQPHPVVIGWLANRNAILSAVFGTLALAAYLRFRDAPRQQPNSAAGTRRWAILASLGMALALAAGEYGLSMLGFFIAYEWLGRSEPLRVRLACLAWVLSPAALFLLLRVIVHAGGRHSGIYLDPLGDPGLYATAVVRRLPVLIADSFLSLRCDYWSFGMPWAVPMVEAGQLDPSWLASYAPWRRVHELLGLLSLGLYAAALFVVARRAAGRGFGHAVWLAVGGVLSTLPLAGSLPTSRLVLVPGIGISALLATLLWDRVGRALERGAGLFRRAGAFIVALTLFGLHLLLAPLQAHDEADLLHMFSPRISKAVLQTHFDRKRAARQRAVIVATGDPTLMIYMRLIRHMHGLPSPRSVWVLSGNRFPFMLERPAVDSLIVRYPPGVSALSEPFEQMFRSPADPFTPGQQIAIGDDEMTVEILSTSQAGPTAMRFVFDTPLEDRSWLFLIPTPEGVRPFPLPAVGAVLPLPPPAIPLPD